MRITKTQAKAARTTTMPSIRRSLPLIGDNHFSGFTLLELIVTLAIVGVLAAYAAPNFSTIIRDHRITALTNDLITELKLARSEAVKRGVAVGVCTADGTVDSLACDGGKDWHDGRALYVDSNTNGVNDAGEGFRGGEVIRDSRKIKVFTTAGAATKLIMFNAQGGSVLGNLLVVVCDDRGQQFGRSIEILQALGDTRVRPGRPAAGAC